MKMKSLFLLLMFSNCFQSDYLVYNDINNNYSLKYEKIWIKKVIDNNPFFFIKNDKSKFRTNVNILVQNLSNNPLNLKEYHEITLNQIENSIGSTNILSKKNTRVGEIEAKELIYKIPKSIQNPHNLKIKQIYFIKENKAVLITYTSISNNFDIYLQSADTFHKKIKVNW
ncbi:hypothetical protein [Polaribacter sp. Asnod1-A03]|uniref:hypothetical protein n=1 Tax=Polaribacter sp. Asnod1-A03 TaxID=3160581 RepID=UPI00386FEF6C